MSIQKSISFLSLKIKDLDSMGHHHEDYWRRIEVWIDQKGNQLKKEWTLFELPNKISGISWNSHCLIFFLRSDSLGCPIERCTWSQFSPCMQHPLKKKSWQMMSSEVQSSSALESTERLSSSTIELLREWLLS